MLVVHRYPTPSLADVFYLVGLLILGPALWVGFGFGSRGQRIRALLDALMWLVVLIYVAVTVMIVPQLRGGQLSGADKVALAETLLAVVAGIWVAGVLMVGQKRIPLGMKLVTLGIAAQAASWVAYSYIYTVSPIQDGSWVLTGWQATWALLIVGAVAELNGDGSDVSGQRASRGLSVWVTTVGVVVLLGLIMLLSPGLNVDLVAVIAALVGFLIVATRLHVSLSDRDQLAGEMRAMAETDALTGIANRRVFDARLSTATAQRRTARRHGGRYHDRHRPFQGNQRRLWTSARRRGAAAGGESSGRRGALVRHAGAVWEARSSRCSPPASHWSRSACWPSDSATPSAHIRSP